MLLLTLPALLLAGLGISLLSGDDGESAENPVHRDGEDFDLTEGTNGSEELKGSDIADLIEGRGGDDLIIGLGGDDFLSGGDGDDVVRGGEGKDRIFLGAGDDELGIVGTEGADFIRGGDGDDIIIDDEECNEIYGDLGNDIIQTCDDGENPLIDKVFGGYGVDLLIVDNGDMVSGGGGCDSFVVKDWDEDDRVVRVRDFDVTDIIETLVIETGSEDSELTFRTEEKGTYVQVDGTDAVYLRGVVTEEDVELAKTQVFAVARIS